MGLSDLDGTKQENAEDTRTAPVTSAPITSAPITVGGGGEQIRLFIEALPDFAVLLLDPEGRIATWNAGAEKLMGYTESEALGQPIDLIFTPEDRESGQPERELRGAQAEGRADDEQWHQRKDGSRFWGSGLMIAIQGQAGQTHGYCKIMRDLTERHQAEERAQAAAAKDRRIAEALQRAMLIPLKENQFPGVSVATLHEAAWEEAQVGGDFFDGFLLSDTLLALAVGDASGKGLEAAVRTTLIKDAVRAFLRSLEDADAALTLARLNDFLYNSSRLDASEDEGFVTLALVLFDTETGVASFSVAGAEPPRVLRADGTLETVEIRGVPLGLFPQGEYTVETRRLGPGDTLLLITDGLTDARRQGEFISLSALEDIIREARASGSAQEMGQAILDRVKEFAGGKLHDDACLLLARRG